MERKDEHTFRTIPDRLLRRPEVERRTGLKRAWIYHLMGRGAFPAPARLAARAVEARAFFYACRKKGDPQGTQRPEVLAEN